MPAQSNDASRRYPRNLLWQGSTDPVFDIKPHNGRDLICQSCGKSVLVRGYREELFWGGRFRCFVCQNISETSSMPPGFILPRSGIIFSPRSYLIEKSVDLPYDGKKGVVSIAQDQRMLEQYSAWPRRAQFNSTLKRPIVAMDNEYLNFLVELFIDIISLNPPYAESKDGRSLAAKKMLDRLSSVRRGMQAKNPDVAKEHTFLWSIETIRHALDKGVLSLNEDNHFRAYASIYMFSSIWDEWGHHARFSEIAYGLTVPGEYDHAVAQFVIAASLFENGVPAGFSARRSSSINPDLYIWQWPSERMSLEVKSRRNAEQIWNNDVLSLEALKRELKSALRSARHQITSSRRGIVAVFMGFKKIEQSTMDDAVSSVMFSQGRNYKGISSLWAVALHPDSLNVVPGTRQTTGMEFSLSVALNRHFEGENPVSENARRRGGDAASYIPPIGPP